MNRILDVEINDESVLGGNQVGESESKGRRLLVF